MEFNNNMESTTKNNLQLALEVIMYERVLNIIPDMPDIVVSKDYKRRIKKLIKIPVRQECYNVKDVLIKRLIKQGGSGVFGVL